MKRGGKAALRKMVSVALSLYFRSLVLEPGFCKRIAVACPALYLRFQDLGVTRLPRRDPPHLKISLSSGALLEGDLVSICWMNDIPFKQRHKTGAFFNDHKVTKKMNNQQYRGPFALCINNQQGWAKRSKLVAVNRWCAGELMNESQLTATDVHIIHTQADSILEKLSR